MLNQGLTNVNLRVDAEYTARVAADNTLSTRIEAVNTDLIGRINLRATITDLQSEE